MNTKTIAMVCSACSGTGLYHGMCEPEGVAVVCLSCNGTGCVELSYHPFIKRISRNDIHTVMRSKGRFIPLGVGPVGNSITYQEFEAGKMP